MDFAVVVSALLEMTGFLPNISAIRAVRALRPLRSLKRLPGVAAIVQQMLNAIPQLCQVVLLLGFGFVFFSILGQQVGGGGCERAEA